MTPQTRADLSPHDRIEARRSCADYVAAALGVSTIVTKMATKTTKDHNAGAGVSTCRRHSVVVCVSASLRVTHHGLTSLE